MKKLTIILVLLYFMSKATFAHVSRKDVKAAKERYLADSLTCLYMPHDSLYYPQRRDIMQMDKLTYDGYKAIRHDQRFYIRKVE